MFRDSVSNGKGLNRWHPIGAFQAVQENMIRQQKNINLLGLRNCPSLLISYEKAQRHPMQFVNEYSEWLGLSPNFDKFDFEGYTSSESYKKFDEYITDSQE